MNILSKINFRFNIANERLAIAVAQDYRTKKVLMVAFVNEEAIKKTLETNFAHYFSTSRKKIWKKGESSGNVQKVIEIKLDCDGDAVLYIVEQKNFACHMGYISCFYRKIENNKIIIDEKEKHEGKEEKEKGRK